MSEFSKLSGDLNAAVQKVEEANNSLQLNLQSMKGFFDVGMLANLIDFQADGVKSFTHENDFSGDTKGVINHSATETDWVIVGAKGGAADGYFVVSQSSSLRYVSGSGDVGLRLDLAFGSINKLDANSNPVALTQDDIDAQFAKNGLRINLGLGNLRNINRRQKVMKHPYPSTATGTAVYARLKMIPVNCVTEDLFSSVVTGSKVFFKSIFFFEGLV